jgi:glucose/arabinose dehydrogenase
MKRVTLPIFLLTVLSSTAPGRIGSEKVADGFERPVWVGTPPKSRETLWVMEQAGSVWSVNLANGKRASEPVLDIKSDVSREGNEEGLLGLAFSPDFPSTGRFYVNYTDKNHVTKIVRFKSAKDQTLHSADGEVLLEFKQPYQNHNGCWLDFGPDHMLYIGTGDGGSGNDPQNYGQALDTLLGKILRIDVSGKEAYRVPSDNPFVRRKNAKPEIWAYGVRNPWRCSFDKSTGDFWMGDVGQNKVEEINFLPRGKGAGANFGWRLREGDIETPANGVGGDKPRGAVEPVYVYGHGGGKNEGMSVTGGYVYRGPIKELQGRYVFADYQNPRIWSFKLERGKATDFQDHTADLQPESGRITLIPSFGEDQDGNLFIVDHSGPIYKIIDK